MNKKMMVRVWGGPGRRKINEGDLRISVVIFSLLLLGILTEVLVSKIFEEKQ
jgi:hypothetical protein